MNLDFVYRSIATTALAPGRSWGAMAHGRLSERRIEYEAGLFRHDGENARPRGTIERQGAATLAMRVAVEPSAQSKSAARTVRAAVAFTRTDVEATPSTLQLRTVFRSPLLADPIWVNGMRRRIGIETQWMPGPASLKFEYMRATEGRRGQGLLETDVEPLVVAGWYASGTWALTGESKADGLDSPRRPLSGGGIGAIELGARIETLAIGNGGRGAGTASPRSEIILGNQDRVVTLGVNWYVNRWVKVQANVIRESLRDALQGPLPIQQGFWSQALRLQVSI